VVSHWRRLNSRLTPKSVWPSVPSGLHSARNLCFFLFILFVASSVVCLWVLFCDPPLYFEAGALRFILCQKRRLVVILKNRYCSFHANVLSGSLVL